MKISIIGAGNMGGATAHGLLKSNTCQAKELCISDPSSQKLQPFDCIGVHTFTDNKEAIKGADVIMVFVKPWLVETILREIRPVLDYNHQILVIIAAGIKSDDVKTWLENEEKMIPSFFLAIPNIAISQCSSMTFIVPAKAEKEQTALIRSIFDGMGRSIIVEERLLAAGTTLASCGLAYAMRYVRAASEGGVELGFYPDDAKDIVLQNVKGAIEILQANGNYPEAEIDKVTTPGGVTIRGLNEMENAGFTSAVIRGLKAGLKTT